MPEKDKKEVQHTKSIPLTLKPVTELYRAIAEADRGDFAGKFDSLKDFNKAFDKEIKNEN